MVRLSISKTKRFGFEMHQEGLFGMCTEIQEWDGNKYIFYRLIICYKKICMSGGVMVALRAAGRESWKEICHSEVTYGVPSPYSCFGFFPPILKCT